MRVPAVTAAIVPVARPRPPAGPVASVGAGAGPRALVSGVCRRVWGCSTASSSTSPPRRCPTAGRAGRGARRPARGSGVALPRPAASRRGPRHRRRRPRRGIAAGARGAAGGPGVDLRAVERPAAAPGAGLVVEELPLLVVDTRWRSCCRRGPPLRRRRRRPAAGPLPAGGRDRLRPPGRAGRRRGGERPRPGARGARAGAALRERIAAGRTVMMVASRTARRSPWAPTSPSTSTGARSARWSGWPPCPGCGPAAWAPGSPPRWSHTPARPRTWCSSAPATTTSPGSTSGPASPAWPPPAVADWPPRTDAVPA